MTSKGHASAALRFVAVKIAVAALTLWVVSVVIFGLVNILPTDSAFVALGHESTAEQRAVFRETMHLNDPPAERYLGWLRGILHGDFGVSAVSDRPIADDILTRLKFTSILAVSALLLSIAISVPLALYAATRAGGKVDTIVTAGALSVSALPEYVIGLVLLVILSGDLHLLPPLSFDVVDGGLIGYFLPVLTLALVAAAYTYRFARVNVVEAMSAPYVRAAVLRGFTSRRILWAHIVPNASAAVVNVVALNIVALFSGVIVIENVFAYPGLGTALLDAINGKDFPSVEAIALIMSGLIIGTNVLADVVVLALTPRLRTIRA